MKKSVSIVLIVLLFAFIVSGCCRFDSCSLLGTNISDLKQARSEGKFKIFDGKISDVFDQVKTKLENNDLKIYQMNKKDGYMVIMGLNKQVDTTRVGIFFEDAGNDQTKVTLSSLSHSALVKIEKMLF
ncbi:MAG: hypothetical protein ABH862_05935 [Candidatus Omnitrophota bacterium]